MMIIMLIILILLIGMGICILPWQNKINVTLDGIQRRIGNDNYNEDDSITIIGTYNKYLFKEDTFIGTISTKIHKEIWNISKGELIFSDDNAILVSIDENNKSNYLGNLFVNEDFSEILILINESNGTYSKGWSSENGLFISAPAKNKIEAIKVAEQLSKKSIWI